MVFFSWLGRCELYKNTMQCNFDCVFACAMVVNDNGNL